MKTRLTFTLILFAVTAHAQDSLFARRMVDTLTSPYFWGRGYTNDGMGKAARFISSQFVAFGLKPMAGKDFLQPFTYNVNTFPGHMEVSINGVKLAPGKDFIISEESRGLKALGKLFKKDSVTYVDPDHRLMVSLDKKLTWSAAQEEADYTRVIIDKKALTIEPATIDIDVDNKFIKNFKANNICAIVRGTEKPDSVIMITAHYDHLGGMGSQTYFPGANDNASGMAMLLSLARYYAAHPQRYTMAVVCFGGEEAGILGSKYFTEHPELPLSSIRFLLNMDIMGTGEEGITAVNATVYPKEFALLQQANTKGHYLSKVASRGKAANSDHYWFTEKGVPAFFIYTMGGIKAYHDVFDISRTLPLNAYNHLFGLITDFVTELAQPLPACPKGR